MTAGLRAETTAKPLIPTRGASRRRGGGVLPVLTMLAGLLAIWYLAAIALNAPLARDAAERAGTPLGGRALVAATLTQERPKLPAPDQIVAEVWKTTAMTPVTSKRSLIYHAWVTLSTALTGLVLGVALGIALAIGIVRDRTMGASVMPWVVASQTVPILAIAPMIIVVLHSIGVSGLLPKALISEYASFFPVTVGMVQGFRSPDPMLIDQMRTWNATEGQVFRALRWPASVPFLFASLKVAAAAAVVGAIIGELPTGAVAGLGARMLSGSYYGQTIQIWSALFMAALLASGLIALVGIAERLTARAMGAPPETRR